MSKISTVSFLGPILEKTAFELMLEKRVPSRQTSYTEAMRLDSIFLSHEETTLDKLKFSDSFLTPKKEKVKISTNDLFGNFKFTPPFLQGVGHQRAGQTPPTAAGNENFVIEGPLAKREILFRPKPPVILKKVEAQVQSFIVELKFKVSSSGKVQDAVLLASSGYSDVDLAAINYIKGFQFSSNPEDKSIWDKVKLNLKSKPR